MSARTVCWALRFIYFVVSLKEFLLGQLGCWWFVLLKAALTLASDAAKALSVPVL